MFEKAITNSPFVSPEADDYFYDSIPRNHDAYKTDWSLISTMRALFGKRIGDDQIYVNVDTVRTRYRENVGTYVRNCADYENNFRVVVAQETSSCSYDESFTYLNSDFDGCNGFTRLKEVTDLFAKNFRCSCFVNPTRKTTILVTEELTLRQWHYMQCALLGLFPWYHAKGDPVSDLEKELIYSLRERTEEKYLDVLKKIADGFNFGELRIRKKLAGFESRRLDRRMDAIRSNVESRMRNIHDYEESIACWRQEINNYNIQLFGYETKKADINDGEMMEFFLNHKDVYLLDAGDDVISFCVHGYLTNWDEDAAESYIRNHNSCMYNGFRGDNQDDIEKVMRAIFIDRKIKIRVCGAYQFRANGGAQGTSGYVYPYGYKDYMPNPHIYNYSCIGDEYKKVINDFTISGRYVDAVTVCLMSVQCVNMNEAPTTGKWFPYMAAERSDIKCYELPNGENVTFNDAMKWVLENENKEETTNE